MSPRSTRGRRPGALSRLAGAAIALSLIVPALDLARASGADAPSTSSANTGIQLVDQSPWVGPTGTFELKINAAPPADSRVVATIYEPISTRTQLANGAKGQGLGLRVESVTVPSAAVTRTSDGALQLDFPVVPNGTTPTYGFRLSNPGVYPFSLSIVATDGTTVARLLTQMIRLPSASSKTTPVSLALVVPYAASIGHRPDRDATVAPDELADLTTTTATLARYSTVPISMAPSPETLDSMAAHDRTQDTHKVADLSAAIAGRPVIASTYVPVDSGAWIAHDLTDGYNRQLVAGRRTATDLLQSTVATNAMVADGTVTPEVLSNEVDQGVTQVVVPSNRLAATTRRTDPNTPLTQWFDLASSRTDRLQAVASDSGLATMLTAGSEPVLAAHEVLAALALIAFDHSGSQACIRQPAQPCRRGVALQLPTDAARAEPALGVLLAALSDPTAVGTVAGLPTGAAPVQAPASGAALLTPVAVPSLFQTVDPAAESGQTSTDGPHQLRRLEPEAVASLGAYPAEFHAATHDTDAFLTMVTGTGSNTGIDLVTSWNQLTLSSGAVGLSSAQRTAFLDTVNTDLQHQLSQITAPTQQTVTLTSATGRIPFSISNALDYPVRVTLNFQSAKLTFVNGEHQTIILAAGRPTYPPIPVRSRASGAFPMQVTITSPAGGLTITQTKFDVRSTAVSEIGLVLTIAAGLFLLLWWARHFRNTRRQRRLVESNHPALRV